MKTEIRLVDKMVFDYEFIKKLVLTDTIWFIALTPSLLVSVVPRSHMIPYYGDGNKTGSENVM